MAASTPDGVELLGASLGYTRLVLAGVRDADLARPTPCADWLLGDLLVHMDDALDAFAEAADGRVWLAPASPALLTAPAVRTRAGPAVEQVAGLQAKACALLGAWRRDPAAVVRLGALHLPAATVARAAALEVAVHGNDVARSLRRPLRAELRHLPEALAAELAGAARDLVGPEERPGRFAAPRPVGPGAGASARLLAALGRAPD